MASRRSRGMAGTRCQTQQQQQQQHTGIPPGLQQTNTLTADGKKTYEYTKAKDHVLVVMRYRRDMDRRIRNCIIRMKGRIRQPGTEGKCLGVQVLECPDHIDWAARSDWCLALFFFPSEQNAERWYNTEMELKQHDFLPPSDGVQLFFVKLRYLPKIDSEKITFNWMEFHNVRSRSLLQEEFVNKVCPLLDDSGVNHGMVFIEPTEVFRLKESWINHNADAYCVVNVFNDEDHFHKIFDQAKYAQLQQTRDSVCDTVSLLFTIDSHITGPLHPELNLPTSFPPAPEVCHPRRA